MTYIRLIPVLLLSEGASVKTRQFTAPVYIGDIVNAASIFNSKMADELMVLDIGATQRGSVNFERLRHLAEECFMPLCYGGGLSSIDDAARLMQIGIEKICINSFFHETGGLVAEAAKAFGSSSVVVSIDVRKGRNGAYEVFTRSGKRALGHGPVEQARKAVDEGAGEIVIQSIDRDGMRCGYDLDLVREIADSVSVPVIAMGGADTLADVDNAIGLAGASAAAAGSMFVLYGRRQAVLITYPDEQERDAALEHAVARAGRSL